jgi:UDP-2,4-diacetamido-2,4,6-trideoxy-beta-L-altropyranose hydrolase
MMVGIRVDASAVMGTGHVRRCLSLARALASLGADIRFLTRDLGVDSSAMIKEQGFDDMTLLSAPDGSEINDQAIPHAAWGQVSVEQDSEETIAALTGFAPDWVVVDSYSFDGRWHDAVREALAARIAQIDDMADRTIAPDLLIDHNYAGDHAAKYAGKLSREAKLLGGPRFALLGPRFADAQRYEFSERVRSVGIFMGGVDGGGFSAIVLAALRDVGFDGSVEIVATSANPHLASLRETIAADPHATLSLDLPDLAEFFARHDIQVGAGGGASWERCCIGVPTLLVIVAENQRAVAPQLAAEGIVALADQPDRATITAALADLLENPDKRRELALRSRELVDGRGATRVAEEMQCFA